MLRGISDRPYNSSFKRDRSLVLNILKRFGFGNNSIMETRINMEVEELIGMIKEKNGQPFNPGDMIARSVLNVLNGILFGRPFSHSDPQLQWLTDQLHKFLYLLVDILPMDPYPILRFVPSVRRSLAKVHKTHSEILQFLEQKIDESLLDKENESFITCFHETEGENYDHQQLLFELRDLNLGGSETSTTSLKWAVIILANHQEVQARLQEEIDFVVPKHRLACFDDRPKLPYIEAAILELMRYRTIVPLGLPHMVQNDTEVGGYFVAAGSWVFTNLYAAHMDPTVWSEPSMFKPERFLDEDGQVVGKEKVVAFSLGKRSCLGEMLARQELFLFFTGLLQHFTILPPEGQDFIDDTEDVTFTMLPKPFTARFIPRKT